MEISVMLILGLISGIMGVVGLFGFIYAIYRLVVQKWTEIQRIVDRIEKSLSIRQKVKLKSKLMIISSSGAFFQLEEGTELYVQGTDDNILTVETEDGLIETRISIEYLEMVNDNED